MIDSKTIANVITSAGSKLVSVRFTKVDGSQRQLTFNPRDFAEIKGTGKACQDPNIFRVRDIKLGAWRSFDARRVHSIKVGGTLVKEQKT